MGSPTHLCRRSEGRVGVGAGVAYLQIPVDHPHLVAMQHSLQDLLDTMARGREKGSEAGSP